jgi:hypothetical protein
VAAVALPPDAFEADLEDAVDAAAARSDPSFADCRADDPDFAGAAAVFALRAGDLDAIAPV